MRCSRGAAGHLRLPLLQLFFFLLPTLYVTDALALSWDDPWVARGLEIAEKVGLALALLLAGWIVAKLIAWMVFRLLMKTDLDDRLAEKLGFRALMDKEEADSEAVERAVAKVVYWLLMLLVFVAVLQFAGLTQVAEPLQRLVDTVVQALPHVGKAILLLLAAYFVGRVLQLLVTKALDRAGVDSRFAELAEPQADDEAEAEGPGEVARPFSQTAGQVVFWLVMIVGLAGAFQALDIKGIAEPLQNALDKVVGFLPDLAIAALIIIGGYVLGKIARTVVSNLLSSAGFDKLPEKARLDRLFEKTTASAFVGLVLMWFVLIQAIITALDRLGLEALSEPLTGMIGQFWDMLPSIAIAVLIVVAGVVVGRVVRALVVNLLKSVGFDDLMTRIGFGKIKDRAENLDDPSELVGLVVQVGIILVAVAQALAKLTLTTWAVYVDTFLSYTVQHVAVALLIIIVGFVLANWVRDLILSRQQDDDMSGRWVATFARYAVLVFAFTMAVTHLDVAQEFVLLTFALSFGGLCLGMAIALGLGGKDVAGEIVKTQYDKAKDKLGSKE